MSTATIDKTAASMRDMAQRLESQIADKRASRRENTPKQQREAASARIDGDHLDRIRLALVKLADAREVGTLPEQFAKIKTKKMLEGMLRTRIDCSGGYYSVADTGEYGDQSELAIDFRNWLENSKSAAEIEAEEEAAARKQLADLEASVKFLKIPGFFPTPESVIELMQLDHIVKPGMAILEPSAGKGDLLDAITEIVPAEELDRLDCCEINHTLCEILKAKGYEPATDRDFLTWDDGPVYDLIVMNPPFENNQAIDHVRHAYEFLKPGGVLLAVVPPSIFTNSDKRAKSFQEWLGDLSHCTTDCGDAFKNSFRSTSVRTLLLSIDKDGE